MDKPFSKGQAWIDLLLMANHTGTRFLLGNAVVTAEAGQIVTSEVKLAARWGWSRTKVRSFLAVLQADNMLTKASGSKRTVLTLCNYSVYNDAPVKNVSAKKRTKTKNAEIQTDITPLFSPLEYAIEEFKTYRAKIRKPMTDRALDLLRKRLQKLAGDDQHLKIAMLEQSILRGWTSVFELKDGDEKALDYR